MGCGYSLGSTLYRLLGYRMTLGFGMGVAVAGHTGFLSAKVTCEHHLVVVVVVVVVGSVADLLRGLYIPPQGYISPPPSKNS